MKTTQRNRTIYIFSLVVLMMSMFVFTACGKKDPGVINLNKQESIVVLEDAVENMLEVDNIYIDFGHGLYIYADEQSLYECSIAFGAPVEGFGQKWELIEDDKWVQYKQIPGLDAEKPHLFETVGEYNTIAKCINSEILFVEMIPELVNSSINVYGVKTGNNSYEITAKITEEQSVKLVINNGCIVEITIGEDCTKISYNLENCDVPGLPNIA